ncbi:hypothetical protein BDV59DRAFT_42407 [Aspergillus ambiguus]|uniref:uncharacterized protein n=1 Tax=Aspergillus ambiguus TaxID=176160 RepID=UPI003CCDE77A
MARVTGLEPKNAGYMLVDAGTRDLYTGYKRERPRDEPRARHQIYWNYLPSSWTLVSWPAGQTQSRRAVGGGALRPRRRLSNASRAVSVHFRAGRTRRSAPAGIPPHTTIFHPFFSLQCFLVPSCRPVSSLPTSLLFLLGGGLHVHSFLSSFLPVFNFPLSFLPSTRCSPYRRVSRTLTRS